MYRRLTLAMVLVLSAAAPALGDEAPPDRSDKLGQLKHIVVINPENHSIDNHFGGREGVNGLADADAAHTTQVTQAARAATTPIPTRTSPTTRILRIRVRRLAARAGSR